ncbi:MAG TPA: hypothetical protein VGN70_04405 [Gammaproteobacteria bacterium]|jgi:hypothetical protein
MITIDESVVPSTNGNSVQNGGLVLQIMQSAVNVNVQAWDQAGSQVVNATNVPAGVKFRVPAGFVRYAIQFTGGGNGQVLVGIGDELDDLDFFLVTGTLNTIPLGGSGLQESADVVTAGGSHVTALIAINAARRTVLIGSPNGNNVAGARVGKVADATHGTWLYPGQSIALDTQSALEVFDNVGGNTFTVQEVLA